MFLYGPSNSLPVEADFDPIGCDLDAQCAWKNFGGLTMAEAYETFLTVPESYQEDFMFMGSRAFAYYFPVVDRYLRTVSLPRGDLGDCEASILGSAVTNQLHPGHAAIPTSLLREIESLHAFVTQNIARYAATPKDERRIRREWKHVAAALLKHRGGETGTVEAAPHRTRAK
jgi:hypothetical protein